MTPPIAHRLRMIFGIGLVTILLLAPASALAQGDEPVKGTGTGFYYVVRPGDTWSGISHTVGVPVSEIKRYNPDAVHPYDYLWIGDRLWIPAPEPSYATEGYWYSVKQGDDWNSVSAVTGAPVSALKAANPIAASDPHDWLYIGQKLWVPTGPPAETKPGAEATAAGPEAMPAPSEAQPGAVATPQPGKEAPATSIAGTAAPVASPTEAPAPAVTGTPTAPTEPEATPEPLLSVEPTAAASVAPGESPAPSETSTAEALAAASATPVESPAPPETPAAEPTPESTPGEAAAAATATAVSGCPADPAAYPVAIAEQLNGPSVDLKALKSWLQSCGLITDQAGDVAEVAAPGAGEKDVAVVIRVAPTGEAPHGELLVYHNTPTGYTLAYQADGSGDLKLLKSKDINGDGKPDLVYIDTSCGAHTCFSTLFVLSWNGTAWQDWIKGEPTMAGAEYSFDDTVAAGEGLEILAHGGIINSAGTGPQRAWTETYVSPEGGPYESYKKAYDASSCLYFQILDANELFDRWNNIGFAPAIAAYDKAVADQSAKACSEIPDELLKLRDFARFRLVVSWVSRGRTDKAVPISAEITYPPLVGATNAFLLGLKNSGSIVQACRDTTKYAEANPAAWDSLTDWGYANPTFTAEELCPLGQ
jgi:LysM repeat protein